jgi:hypothetical protein
MGQIDCVKSYEGVRGRAATYQTGGQKLLAGCLDDIIPRGLAMKKPPLKKNENESSAALKAESGRSLTELMPGARGSISLVMVMMRRLPHRDHTARA